MQPGSAGLEGCSIKLAFGKQRAINTHQHEAIRGLIKEDHSLGKMEDGLGPFRCDAKRYQKITAQCITKISPCPTC